MAIFDKFKQQLNTRMDQAKFNKDVEPLRKALQQKPNDPDTLRQLATLYETAGMAEEATKSFLHLAQVYQQLKQSALAVAYYHKAERLADKEHLPSILKDLEQVHHSVSQYDEAYQVARQVVGIYLELNQKEAARGFVNSLPQFGEKEQSYRKELREMIGEKDESWAQGARGTWVAEESPKPTQLIASLPGYKSAKIPPVSPAEKEIFTRLSILVVDDDPIVCKLLSAAFKAIGCQIIIACDGAEGLTKALESHPTLIICDLLMPKMDGNQFFDALQQYPEVASIPFVCLSSRGQEDEKLAAFEKGVEDYWVKPFIISEIVMRTKKILLRQVQTQSQVQPALNKPASNTGQTEMVGNLNDIPFTKLLRMIEYLGKTGILHVTSDNMEGTVTFQSSSVVDAECNNLVGEPAIFTMITWTEGTFAFQVQDILTPHTITASIDEIFAHMTQYTEAHQSQGDDETQ